MCKYKYKISCVMAIYNVEKYIDEAISSIIKQNIGFIENVQLILVNDGSTDSSGEICDKYKALYPQNVVVIHKENQGVAATKNVGLLHTKGEFITFIDPDDKISKETMKVVYEYFLKVKSITDVVAIPMLFFEEKKGNHPLNYKFGKVNQVVSLNEKPTVILLSTAAAFYRESAIQDKKFNEQLEVSEDFRFNYEIFKENPNLGLVPKGKYLYRRRVNQSSLIKTRWNNANTYTPYIRLVHMYLLKEYKSKFEYVPKYLQFAMMYDLQWIIKKESIPEGVISQEEKSEFINLIAEALEDIDEDVIFAQRYLSKSYMLYALELKMNNSIEKKNNINIIKDAFCKCPVYVKATAGKKGKLVLKITVDIPEPIDEIKDQLALQIGPTIEKPQRVEKVIYNKSLGRDILNTYVLEYEIDVDKDIDIELIIKNYGEEIGSHKSILLKFIDNYETNYKRFFEIVDERIIKTNNGMIEIRHGNLIQKIKHKVLYRIEKLKEQAKHLAAKVYFNTVYMLKIK